MAHVWMTKYGPRRVRHDPPTLDEALFAAECLTDDVLEQAEIAAALMGLPLEPVRLQAVKTAPRRAAQAKRSPVLLNQATQSRPVVIEHKKSRRPAPQARPRSLAG